MFRLMVDASSVLVRETPSNLLPIHAPRTSCASRHRSSTRFCARSSGSETERAERQVRARGLTMLVELRIEQLGVIDEVTVVFGDGLTVLTGETGAGKTMIVEAINLLVGQRADASMVRAGADELRVEGRFVLGDGTDRVLCRVVPRDGRSRAYVDGRLATVATLAEFGADLVDIHGQHEHQSLLGAAAQRAALDAYAEVNLEPLRAARAVLTEVDAALATMGGDERARAREVDLLRFQVDEIRNAHLDDPDEDASLERQIDLLQGAESHRESLRAAIAALVDDDGAVDRLAAGTAALGRGEAMREHAERIRELQALVADLADDMRRVLDKVDEDPQRLAALVERRQLLFDLRRKYGDDVAAVIAYGAESAARLAELESWEARAGELDRRRQAALAEVQKQAARVRAAREKAAPRLAKEVEGHLARLALAGARVQVQVGTDVVGDPAGDEVTFLMAANPGSEPAALARVASGGELARAMLALRLVLTQAPATLVFDEVDAGIGGAAAVAVADALADLGARHQVLVVTHLAQVAAQAAHQVAIAKEVRKGITFATARTLHDDERVDEVARMLSGDLAVESAVEHARNLLNARKSPRKARSTRR
ncbi:MAG: DNA repair protein RecN [Actinobacteria bacterium]|nr:DNA repair protein RecN [Actinomycetota bacterium]